MRASAKTETPYTGEDAVRRRRRAWTKALGRSLAAPLQRLLADRGQRGGGRDHFLGQAQLDDRRLAAGQRALEGRRELLRRLHGLAVRAERPRVCGEIRVR